MKLPVAVFSLFTVGLLFTFDVTRHDWPVAAFALAVGALMTVFWTHQRTK